MCDITLGRAKTKCKTVAGWAAIYFIPTSQLGIEVTYGDSGSVEDFANGTTAYKYDLISGTVVDDDSQGSIDTGAKFNNITGTITLQGHQDRDQIEFDNLQSGLYSIVGERRNGTAKLFSPDRPIDITSIKMLHGDGEGDLIGATMDLVGKSDKLSPNIIGAVKGNPFAGIATPANVTITTGS